MVLILQRDKCALLSCVTEDPLPELKVATFVDDLALDLSSSSEKGLGKQIDSKTLAKQLTDRLAVYWRREEDLSDAGELTRDVCLHSKECSDISSFLCYPCRL